MLRITQSTSPKSAQSYFQELLKGDYYTGQEMTPGRFGGKASEQLGLDGVATTEAFAALTENRHPVTGERLTQRTRDNRTSGWDFTFNAPKSLSLCLALTGDERLKTAFQEAVRETMKEIETEAKCRVRKGGANTERTTGNLCWVEFYHSTSRPVDGVPDMHTHCHVYVHNLTFDQNEKAWKALYARDIKRDAPYHEAAFHARLAYKVADLGYGIERTKQGWEIAGIGRPTINKFSRRTQQIEEAAQSLGITDPDAKANLGQKTREHKQGHSHEALRSIWDGRLTPKEREQIARACDGQPPTTPPATARQAVNEAILHSFERASVISEKELLGQALRRAVGCASVEEVQQELAGRDMIRRQMDGRPLVTTREVMREEMRLIAFARDGRNSCAPLGPPDHPLKFPGLGDQQAAACRHVLTSTDRVILIRGAAGTGKTTLMRHAVEGIEGGGRKVFTFGPTAESSRGVLRQEGFAEADTVARLLQDQELQQRLRGGVVWVDEAGMLGSKDLGHIFAIAKEQNARVILSGDWRQHSGVARGDAARILCDLAGVKPAEVQDIRRQRGGYKAAVEDLSKGNIAAGFAKLDALGFIQELPDEARNARLTADYLEAVREKKTALVVSPTHFEGQRVTASIRQGLRKTGNLGPDERSLGTLSNFNLTQGEKQDPLNYQAGDVVQFHQNARGFKRGERATVAGHDEQGRILVRKAGGQEVSLPLGEAKRFDVYEAGRFNLAAGDLLRITQNGYTADRKHRLNNGAIYQVQNIARSGDIKLTNGWVLGRDFGHITHGYVVTSHAAQGRTVDRVLIAQGAESFPASNDQQLYVSVSRAREKATIYTNDKQALLEAATRSGQRLSALELARDGKEEATSEGRQPWHTNLFQRLTARARQVARMISQQPENQRETIVVEQGRHHTGREPGRGR